MKNRLLCHLIVSVCILTACAGNKPATPTEVRAGSPLAPATTAAPTTVPSETPSPVPTIEMTATITPENFGLVGSGFDIANVQVFNLQADTVHIDFKYRLDRDYVLPPDQKLFVMLLMPSACKDEHTNDPRYEFVDAIGSGGFAYKQNSKSKCSLPFFDMTINSQDKDDSTNVHFKELYRERINQPLEVAGNSLVIDASNLTVKNVEFHTTGPWSGQLTFDYEFRADIAPEQYRFALNAGAVVRACSLGAPGPVLTSPEGKYTIEIHSSSAWDPTCFDNRDRFSYEGATIELEDVLTNSRLFSHAIEFTITLKKAP